MLLRFPYSLTRPRLIISVSNRGRCLPNILVALLMASWLPAAIFASTLDQEKAAQEIATLFRAARKVISDNQALINDVEKGDKGLTRPSLSRKPRRITRPPQANR
ncbi:MAG: hypothetical protein L0Z50_39810 [Verrucomicrobiales bacterium]|nr:hypothetical protein [Verrucomicrobiales bacterium]